MKTIRWALPAIIALGLLVAASAEAATFYVDPVNGSSTGNGSQTNPWRTLQEVFSQNRIESRNANGTVKNSGAPVKAGDTIVLLSGYHGDISVSNYYNDALITVIAAEDHNPQLRRLIISGFKNWRFSGLEISTELSPTFAKLSLVSVGGTSSYVTIDNCLVYCVSDITGFTAQNWIDRTANGITVGVDSRHIQILDNIVRNTAFAINLSGMNLLVRGNEIINYRGDGIRALNNDQTIEYNVIKNAFKVDDNHDDGIQVFKHNVSQGLIVNMVIRGNYILDNEDPNQPLKSSPQGIGMFEGPHENFRIENNLIITNHWHGITLYWGRNSTIINNTVVNPKYISGQSNMNTWISIEKAKSGYGGEFSQNCRIANNFAHSFRTGGNIGLVFENNMVVTRTNYDSIFANFNLGDYTLKSTSPGIDAGSSFDAPMLDILLNPRPFGQRWDIGCYEFVGAGGPPQPPVAVAGPDRTIYDANGNGSEVVTLDGSGSYSSGGSITSWLWTIAGETIATAAIAQVTLPLGVHDITLTVTNNAEPPDSGSDTVRITVSRTPPVTSTLLWQNFNGDLPGGTFTVRFDAQPSANNIDGVFGLSNGPASDFTHLACIFRFNVNGRMDVRNGLGYAADVQASYAAGLWYHVRMVVNLDTRTYSVFVTPEGQAEFALATDYAFRSDQSNVQALTHWSIIHTGTGGTVTVKDFGLPPELLPLQVIGWNIVANHGDAGDIISPLVNNMVESRLAGLSRMQITFNQAINPDSLITGAITISAASSGDMSPIIASMSPNPEGTVVTIILSSPLPDADTYTIVVTTAISTPDGRSPAEDISRTIRVLAGDVDGSGQVNAADVLAVRSAVGSPVTAATARFDITGSGKITGQDLRAARSRIGQSLP